MPIWARPCSTAAAWPPIPAQPNLRQVHLIHAEPHDELRARGFDVAPGTMGENVTTRGVDLLGLPTGAMLKIGADALLAVTGLRNPCRQLDDHQDGLLAAVLDRDAMVGLIAKAASWPSCCVAEPSELTIPSPSHCLRNRITCSNGSEASRNQSAVRPDAYEATAAASRGGSPPSPPPNAPPRIATHARPHVRAPSAPPARAARPGTAFFSSRFPRTPSSKSRGLRGKPGRFKPAGDRRSGLAGAGPLHALPGGGRPSPSRSPDLRSGGNLDLLVDGTGVKMAGDGDWQARKHSPGRLRQWCKVHLVIDAATSDVRAVEFTSSREGDSPVLPDLLRRSRPTSRSAPSRPMVPDGHAQVSRRHRRPRRYGHYPHPSKRSSLERRLPRRQGQERGSPSTPRRFGRALWKRWTGHQARSRAEAKRRCSRPSETASLKRPRPPDCRDPRPRRPDEPLLSTGYG